MFCWSKYVFCWTVGRAFKQTKSAKRQNGLQLNLEPVQSKLYSHNGCYLHYTFTFHIAKYLKRNLPTQKCASVEEPPAKQRQSTLLPCNLKENWLFCREMCSLRPHLRNAWRWKKSILCRTPDRGKGKKVSRMSYCSYVILYQWLWKFKHNSRFLLVHDLTIHDPTIHDSCINYIFLCIATNRLTGVYSLHSSEKLKDFTE